VSNAVSGIDALSKLIMFMAVAQNTAIACLFRHILKTLFRALKIQMGAFNYSVPTVIGLSDMRIRSSLVQIGKYLFRILVSIDQLGNTILGGDEDETLSSRFGKAKRQGKWWGQFNCWWLDKLDPGHCEDAIESDEGKNALLK
jgi:hypothetical protein